MDITESLEAIGNLCHPSNTEDIETVGFRLPVISTFCIYVTPWNRKSQPFIKDKNLKKVVHEIELTINDTMHKN